VHLTSKPEAPSTAKKERKVWVLVAHSCGASYSGGRDQDDCSSKPARANSSRDPILKNPITKNWTSGVAQSEGPEFKTQYHKKKKKRKGMKGNEGRQEDQGLSFTSGQLPLVLSSLKFQFKKLNLARFDGTL
jgi:hypothetical protein